MISRRIGFAAALAASASFVTYIVGCGGSEGVDSGASSRTTVVVKHEKSGGAAASGTQAAAEKSSTPTVPTKGRVLDHIGFDISDLQGFVGKLQAAGIKLDRPYSKNDTGVGIAFITDPWGTYIELNERPNAVYLP